MPRVGPICDLFRDYLDIHKIDVSLLSIFAHLNIDPSYREFVGEILDGEMGPDSEALDRRSTEPAFGYEPKAIVDRDGNEHEPGGGGVDMVSLGLPIRNIIQNTQLQHDLAQGEIFRDGRTEVASHNPRTIASGFVKDGITDPQVVERLLIVEDYHVSNPTMDRDDRRPCMAPQSE